MNEKPPAAPNDPILHRIRGEYLEMPGLRLTEQQAQRFWGLDRHRCAELLDALIETRFLCRRKDGSYVRMSDGEPIYNPA